MLIAVDGSSRRNGDPECASCGVAWIQREDGNFLFKAIFENTGSSNQRGELNGLISALAYARDYAELHEDIIIVTDSEYIHNTISLDWIDKWQANNWIGSSGTTVKNVDLMQIVYKHLQNLRAADKNVYMQWTKGHLIHYTPSYIQRAMTTDNTGVELYNRILALANRDCDKPRIIMDFMSQRIKHDYMVPPHETAFEWTVANTVADALATYLISALDK